MKEVTIIGYNYNELGKKVQRSLKEKIVHSWEYMDDFNWEIQDIIYNEFPNSDIKIQWSLNCCQGDGVNIYSTLDYRDAIEFIKKMQPDKIEEDFIRDDEYAASFYDNTFFTSSGIDIDKILR